MKNVQRRPQILAIILPLFLRLQLQLNSLRMVSSFIMIPSSSKQQPHHHYQQQKSNYFLSSLGSSLSSSVSSLAASKSYENSEMHNNNNNQNDENNLKHIAFICDGNSRWANHKQAMIPNHKNKDPSKNIMGYIAGAANVLSTVRYIRKNYPSITHVSAYIFSTENWIRSEKDVNAVWNILGRVVGVNDNMNSSHDEKHVSSGSGGAFRRWALREGVIVKIIGDMNDGRVPVNVKNGLQRLEEDTTRAASLTATSTSNRAKGNFNNLHPLTLSLAVNYGGRKDIVQASIRMAQLLTEDDNSNNKDKNKNNDTIDITSATEETFKSLLCTANIPNVDLVVRTGGECRLSNFLLWECAYAELYFVNEMWPDFDTKKLEIAMDWYNSRSRRFGGRKGEEEEKEDGGNGGGVIFTARKEKGERCRKT